MTDLLPDNASPFMRELAALSSRLDELDPGVIETVWDAWRCPKEFLILLAGALSVDLWQEDWDEIRKRQAIADSPAYHRIKGTRRAVENALALLLRPYSLTEWWEQVPLGRRGTARVHVQAGTAEVYAIARKARPLVESAKPKSRAVFVGVGELAEGGIVIGAGLLEETLTTIEPYAYAGENADGGIVIGAGLLVEELTTIEAAA